MYALLIIYITNTEQVQVRKCRTHIHATKVKDLVGSYQTLLLINQLKPRILWVNSDELTNFAQN